METLVYWGCPPAGPLGRRRLVGILWNISRSWFTAASRSSSPSTTLRERSSSSLVIWNALRYSIMLRPFSTSSSTGSDSGNLVVPPLGVAPLKRGGGPVVVGRRSGLRPGIVMPEGGRPTGGWPVGYLRGRRASSCDDRLGDAVEMDLDEYVIGPIVFRRASTLGEGNGHLLLAHSPPEQLLLPL